MSLKAVGVIVQGIVRTVRGTQKGGSSAQSVKMNIIKRTESVIRLSVLVIVINALRIALRNVLHVEKVIS